MKNKKWYIVLNLSLLLYSCSGIFSKLASNQKGIDFIFCYGGMIAVLLIYAILWQQIIKRLPLTVAFANKAITIVWGMLLGRLVFQEQHTPRQIVAAGVIIVGVVLYILAGKENEI